MGRLDGLLWVEATPFSPSCGRLLCRALDLSAVLGAIGRSRGLGAVHGSGRYRPAGWLWR